MSENIDMADDSPHIIAVLRQAALRRKRPVKFRVADGKAETYASAAPAPDFEAAIAAVVAEERRGRTEEEIIAKATPGQKINGHGVFLGTWAPQGLGKIFNVFAAPEDLRPEHNYGDMVRHVSELKNWHGFAGTNYADDGELYEALGNNTYNGGWFIPPRALLNGKDADGNKRQADNLYTCKNNGSLKASFSTLPNSGDFLPGWYWSSTAEPGTTYTMWATNFSNGQEFGNHKIHNRLSCRPVRLEPKR